MSSEAGLVGAFLDILDFKQMQWAGRQLGDDVPYQFVEGEYMKADEYDHFLSDMSDFVMRKYWPRISGALKGLEKLPPFRNIFSYSRAMPAFAAFSLPEVQEALDTLKKAGEESTRVASYARRFNEKLKEEGFPLQGGGGASTPFDVLGDFFRGTKGLMLDMYRTAGDGHKDLRETPANDCGGCRKQREKIGQSTDLHPASQGA